MRFVYFVSNYLFWEPHVVHRAGAAGELREYESGGLGARHRLVRVDEGQLLPELGGCKVQMTGSPHNVTPWSPHCHHKKSLQLVRLTEVEPPHLVERLPLAVPAEQQHHRQELDGAVAVQVAGPGLRLDRPPPPRDEVEAPEVGSFLQDERCSRNPLLTRT